MNGGRRGLRGRDMFVWSPILMFRSRKKLLAISESARTRDTDGIFHLALSRVTVEAVNREAVVARLG